MMSHILAILLFFASMICSFLLYLVSRESPPEAVLTCPKVEALEKAVQAQVACAYENCAEEIERWGKSREYPCAILRDSFHELEAKFERKCPETTNDATIRDCKADLNQCVQQTGSLKMQVASCCMVDAQFPNTCTSPSCKERRLHL